jgi:hypothetical protein
VSRLTLDDLRTMLAQRPAEELEGESDDDRLLWWFAVTELAPSVHEDSTVRDIAQMFVNGITKLTVSEVQEWIDQQYGDYATDCDLTEDQVTAEIKERVREFLEES